MCSPNISSSVTLQLSDVPHTTQTEPVKLAVKRSGDTLGDTRLADSRWAIEADDFAVDSAFDLADSDELLESLLEVLETVMVLIENTRGSGKREGVDGVLAPGDSGKPIEVISENTEGEDRWE